MALKQTLADFSFSDGTKRQREGQASNFAKCRGIRGILWSVNELKAQVFIKRASLEVRKAIVRRCEVVKWIFMAQGPRWANALCNILPVLFLYQAENISKSG